MRTIVTLLLILALVAPARAWYPYSYGNPNAAAGLAIGAASAAVLAALLVGNEARSRSETEQRMLAAAVRANQYENYLIAMMYFNSYTKRPVVPYSTKEKWIEWRMRSGLEFIP